MKKMVVGLVVAGTAMMGATSASALDAWSPSGKAYSYTRSNDDQVGLKLHKLGIKAHADYYRTTDPSEYYTLWNKTGVLGDTQYSGHGGRVTSLRTCNWVPDNDDDCSKFYRG
ncbi:hypothetical protein ACFYNY_10985 [Streptomyces sp. NPDC006530]|uniref:hypothetical protein n=1 Tax=Streptomyces sp. NPDC006530 TaxID=3364750 RepID=UPI0036B750AF